MTEPEVSLATAMHYIQNGETSKDGTVSIDGANVKAGNKAALILRAFCAKTDTKNVIAATNGRLPAKIQAFRPALSSPRAQVLATLILLCKRREKIMQVLKEIICFTDGWGTFPERKPNYGAALSLFGKTVSGSVPPCGQSSSWRIKTKYKTART